MPKASTKQDGLTDTWGRRNREIADKTCAQCGSTFRPKRDAAKYCSRPCLWANNGGHNKKPETWWITPKGYVQGKVWLDEHTQVNVKKHRWVMEKHLGRSLLVTEDVHHKDGNKLNNELANLEIMSHGEHSTHHNLSRVHPKGYTMRLTEEQRRQRSENMKQTRARLRNAKAEGKVLPHAQ